MARSIDRRSPKPGREKRTAPESSAESSAGSSGARGAQRLRASAIGAGWLIASFGALCGSVACNCTPKRASELARADLYTPRHTVDAFRAYASAELYDLEYRCFSRAFTRSRNISVLNYSEARAELKRRQPWLFWFDSEVVADEVLSDREHVLDVRVAGRTVRVKLVREETFRIWAGEELLADGPLAMREALNWLASPGGRSMLTVTLPTGEAAVDVSQITRVSLEQCWKIDDLIDESAP